MHKRIRKLYHFDVSANHQNGDFLSWGYTQLMQVRLWPAGSLAHSSPPIAKLGFK
ncbi:hypothetical protein [Mesohalobacter halotolerans]|uniref:hypothetical protein n=1 Tax=Mesohalobacter halotolerans TaxID=1883405 RepID=UPI0014864F08|nr:hypothetical protein [Mesohalobacter halotolerans]MBS3737897.1 hypothetical protein [Psychroflexus sp.]